jgi:uncharacterized membrane protein
MKRFFWPIFIYTMLIVSLILVWQDSQFPQRPFITLLFILLCPGMAYIRLIPIDSRYIELMLGVTLSIAIGQLVSMAILYLGHWSVELNMILLGTLTFVGTSLQMRQLLFSPDI